MKFTHTIIVTILALSVIIPSRAMAKDVDWTTVLNGWNITSSVEGQIPSRCLLRGPHFFYLASLILPNDSLQLASNCAYYNSDANVVSVYLSYPSITIKYHANVYREGGNLVNDGDTIPNGTRLYFKTGPYTTSDIYWFTTGNYYDSPYGRWSNDLNTNRNFSSVANNDYHGTYFGVNENVVWALDKMSADAVAKYPPTLINTASLTNCTSDPNGYYDKICTATNGTNQAISQTISFNFAPTQGRITGYGGTVSNSDTSFDIPAQSISYTFNVAPPANRPPNIPVITGPSTLNINQVGSFNASAYDPDGDDVRAGWGWGTTTVQQWQDYITSNQSLASRLGNSFIAHAAVATAPAVTKSWNATGTYTIYVKAQDSGGAESGWASKQVTVIDPCAPPPQPTNLSPQGSINPGNQTITWTGSPQATSYELVIDDITASPTFDTQAGDTLTTTTATSYPYTFKSGHTYIIGITAINSCGNRSTTASATITTGVLSPTVSLTVNGVKTLTAVPNSNVTLQWTSQYTQSCTSNNFITGNTTSGSVSYNAGITSSSPTITCQSAYTNTSAQDSVTINVNTASYCGDGIVQSWEECDGGSSCDTTCHFIRTPDFCIAHPGDQLCVNTYGTPQVTLYSRLSGTNAPFTQSSKLAIPLQSKVDLYWTIGPSNHVTCTLASTEGLSSVSSNQAYNAQSFFTFSSQSKSVTYIVTCSNPVGTSRGTVSALVLKPSEF